LLAGKLAADVARFLLQAAVIVGLGLLLGARPSPSPLGLAISVLALGLFGLFMAACSCAIAMVAKNPEGMATYVHLVNMPLLFTSAALVPQAHMSGTLATISSVNPLSLAVSTWRAALVFGEIPPLAPVVVLFVLAAAALLAATRALRRATTH
jgi:ABC-2 type transport system permease protein